MPPRTRSTTTTAPAGRRPKVAGLRAPGRGVTGESGPVPARDTEVDPDVRPADDTETGTIAPAAGDTVTAGPASSTAATETAATADTDAATATGGSGADRDTDVVPGSAGPSVATSGDATDDATDGGAAAAPVVGKDDREDRDGGAARPTPKARRTGRSMTPSAPAGPAARRGGGTAVLDRPAPARPARDEPARESRLGRVAASVTRPVGALGANPRRLVTVLVVVLVLSLGLGTWAFVAARADRAEGTPYANQAVVDVAGTAEVVGQTRQAIESILSYDFTKLDDSVNAARTQATGTFASEYLSVFEQTIRGPATEQKLRQTATVLNIGVEQLSGDRATLMGLVQFAAQRTTNGQTTNAPGLLMVQVVKEDGRWKISELKPL